MVGLFIGVAGLALVVAGACLVFRNVGVDGRKPVAGMPQTGVTPEQFRRARRWLRIGLWICVAGSALQLAVGHIHL